MCLSSLVQLPSSGTHVFDMVLEISYNNSLLPCFQFFVFPFDMFSQQDKLLLQPACGTSPGGSLQGIHSSMGEVPSMPVFTNASG